MRPSDFLAVRRKLANELLNGDGGWVEMCRGAISNGQLEQLEAEPGIWEAFESVGTVRPLDSPEASFPTTAGIARAVLKLAQTLTKQAPIGPSVRDAMDLFDSCGLSSTSGLRPTGRPDTSNPELAAVHGEIEKAGPDHPSAAFTSLLARYLSGEDLKRLRTVEVPVLFDQLTTGSAGRLKVTEIRNGPAGLHPDPWTMVFLTVDHAFVEALRDAWAITPKKLRASNRSFMWELIDEKTGSPLHHVAGSSLGAAWYVALDALRPGKFHALIRPRNLDPKCAITGGLNGFMLASVKGYDNKFKAAAEHGLRVVYPAVDTDQADLAATRYAATADPAKDAPAAVRATRTRLDKKAIARIAVTLVFSLSVALGIVIGVDKLIAEDQRQRAANLLVKASKLQYEDPRLAALLGMASNKIAPSQDAAESMAATADTNDMIAGTISVSHSEIWRTAASSRIVVAAASDGTITAIDIATRAHIWNLRAFARDIALSPDGSYFTVIDYSNTLAVYSLTETGPQLVHTRKLESGREFGNGEFRVLFPARQSVDGPRLYVITPAGVQVSDPGGSARQDVPLQESRWINYATWTETSIFGPGIILALDDGSILFWSPEQPKYFESLRPGGSFFGIFGLSMKGTKITVATSRGTFAVDVSGDLFSSPRGAGNGNIKTMAPLPAVDEQRPGVVYDMVTLEDGGITFSDLNYSHSIRRGDLVAISPVPSSGMVAVGTSRGDILLVDPYYHHFGKTKQSLGPWRSILAFADDNYVLAEHQYSNGNNLEKLSISELDKEKPAIDVFYELPTAFGQRSIESVASSSQWIAAQSGSGDLVIWDAKTTSVIKVFKLPEKDEDSRIRHASDGILFINNDHTLLAQLDGVAFFISTKDWTMSSTMTSERIYYPSSGPLYRVQDQGHDLVVDRLDPTSGTVLLKTTLKNMSDAWVLAGSQRILAMDDQGETLFLLSPDGAEVLEQQSIDSYVLHVASGPQDTLIISTYDRRVKVVDAQTLETISPLSRSTQGEATWNEDGKRILLDGALWDIKPRAIDSQLCSIAGNDLTDQEWQTYIGSSVARIPLC